MRIVALSDTHGQHGHIAVPPGDVLIHAGDLTLHGEPGRSCAGSGCRSRAAPTS